MANQRRAQDRYTDAKVGPVTSEMAKSIGGRPLSQYRVNLPDQAAGG